MLIYLKSCFKSDYIKFTCHICPCFLASSLFPSCYNFSALFPPPFSHHNVAFVPNQYSYYYSFLIILVENFAFFIWTLDRCSFPFFVPSAIFTPVSTGYPVKDGLQRPLSDGAQTTTLTKDQKLIEWNTF